MSSTDLDVKKIVKEKYGQAAHSDCARAAGTNKSNSASNYLTGGSR